MGIDIRAPYVRAREFPSPAVGADFTLTVDGGASWRILCFTFQFDTDATAASRAIRLRADDGGNPFFVTGPEADQAASITRTLTVVNGAHGFGGLSGLQLLAWPDTGLWLRPGWRLRTATTNIQAGDQFSQISALIQEYPIVNDQEWLPAVPYAPYGQMGATNGS